MKWRCRAAWPEVSPEWGEVKKVLHDRHGTYAVTPNGEVFILDEYGQWERRPQYLHRTGYMHVNITRQPGPLLRVNRAICTAYYGQPTRQQVAAHINNDPTDNNRWNLRWMTQRENIRQAIREGRNRPRGRVIATPRGTRTAIGNRNGRLAL